MSAADDLKLQLNTLITQLQDCATHLQDPKYDFAMAAESLIAGADAIQSLANAFAAHKELIATIDAEIAVKANPA